MERNYRNTLPRAQQSTLNGSTSTSPPPSAVNSGACQCQPSSTCTGAGEKFSLPNKVLPLWNGSPCQDWKKQVKVY